MSEMIERVARSICSSAGCNPDEPSGGFEGLEKPTKRQWENWTLHARAAIEEMREPSGAMLDAGGDALDPHCGCECSPGDVFRAMLDASLGSEKKPT